MTKATLYAKVAHVLMEHMVPSVKIVAATDKLIEIFELYLNEQHTESGAVGEINRHPECTAPRHPEYAAMRRQLDNAERE